MMATMTSRGDRTGIIIPAFVSGGKAEQVKSVEGNKESPRQAYLLPTHFPRQLLSRRI
jgi:hypothetical protein